jgi:hypothetical protein
MDLLAGDGTQIEFVEAMTEGWERLTRHLREAGEFWRDTFGLGETAEGGTTAGGEVRQATRGLDRSGPTRTAAGDVERDLWQTGDLAFSQTPEQRAAIVQARLASLVPAQGGRSSAPTTTTIDRSVTIQRIDASGLTEAQATRVVQTAVRAELDRQASDSLDTLARGAVE